jgi:hypothetical protein
VPSNRLVSSGVMKTAPKVLAVVMATDRGTSALARYVTMFDAVPPGQAPTMQSPIVQSNGSCAILEMMNARDGITVYCNTTPIKICFGADKTLLKSSNVSVKPIPNIESPIAHVTTLDGTHVMVLGCATPRAAKSNTKTGK